MKYERIDMGSYHIHFVPTDKFKTTTISINFREKVKKENITIRKFLFQMLTTTTSKYSTPRLFETRLEELYSLSMSQSNMKFGNYINSYIDIKFLDEKYSDKNLIYDSIDLLYEMIFNPNIKDNKIFNIIKEKINIDIKSIKENTQKYAINKALEVMDNTDPISFNMWGYKKDLNKINEEELYKYYKEVIDTNIIDIFVIGNINKDKVLKYISSKFNFKKRKDINIDPFITYNNVNKLKIKNEKMQLNQSKLVVICKLLNLSIFERRYVLPIYTSILGSGSSSRLFTNIREKNSLAYTVNALNNGPNSIMIINCGIDLENYNKALKLIKNEFKLKNITKEELENAKKEIITSVEMIFDTPANIINYYYGIEVFKSDDINTKINNYNKVTEKDIELLSNKINIATIYLLKGIQDEEK